MHDYAYGEHSIPQTGDRLQAALGSLYIPGIWGKLADAVRKGEKEEDRGGEKTMDAAFEMFIAPEQQRLDLLEQTRYLPQEI